MPPTTKNQWYLPITAAPAPRPTATKSNGPIQQIDPITAARIPADFAFTLAR